MFKKLLFNSALFLCGSFFSNAQVTSLPFIESFEENSTFLSQWTQIQEVYAMPWTFVNSSSTGGVSSAYNGSRFANFAATSFSSDRTKLVSPVLELSGYTNINLEFYYINRNWGGDLNWLRIYYKTSASGAWIELAALRQNVTNWTSAGIYSLPSNVYQVAIEGEALYGYSIVVDYVTITGTLSLNNFDKNPVKMYPNPTSQILNLSHSTTINNVRILNVLGQEVLSKDLNSNETTLDVAALQNGTYMVEITAQDGKSVQKLIKN